MQLVGGLLQRQSGAGQLLYLLVGVLPLLEGIFPRPGPLFPRPGLLIRQRVGVYFVYPLCKGAVIAVFPQRVRQLLCDRVREAHVGKSDPAVAADLKRIKRIVQPVLLYGAEAVVIAGGIQIDTPAVLIVACQQIQHGLCVAIRLCAAAEKGVLLVLIVEILAGLPPQAQQAQRVRHGVHGHGHLHGVAAVQKGGQLCRGQLRFTEHRRVAHAVCAVTLHAVGLHSFHCGDEVFPAFCFVWRGAARRRQKQQKAQHKDGISFFHRLSLFLSCFCGDAIITRSARRGKQKNTPGGVFFCFSKGGFYGRIPLINLVCS